MKKQLPRKIKQWAREAVKALNTAWRLAEQEKKPLIQAAKERLYAYGPILFAKNRGITDQEKVKKAAEYAFAERSRDFDVEPECINNYSINFLLAYLDSHVPLQFLSEHKVHEIMTYLVEHADVAD